MLQSFRLHLAPARVLGVAALVVVTAACGGGASGPSKTSTSNAQTDQLAGHYTGKGSYVSAISFDVSDDGSTLTHFHGFITASCYTGGSLYSGANHTVYNQYTMDDPDSVDIDDSNEFSSTYTIDASTKAGFTFEGKLDGSGGATGTVSYKNGACASITAPWSASLEGVSPPPIPGAAGASPSAPPEGCDPQSCATIPPLVLTVQGFHTGTATDGTGAAMLELDFTLASTSQDSTTGFSDQLLLDDGSHDPIGPGNGIASVTLSSGDTVQCDHGVDVHAGETLSLHWCYAQGDLDTSQSIRLDWNSVRGNTAHIDLGTPD